MSVNLPLHDAAYPLLEKLTHTQFTFRNALTLKPITRLAAAHLVAEAIRNRRREREAQRNWAPFLDQTLQELANQFKHELREIGAFYQPRLPGSVVLRLLDEATLELAGTYDSFVRYDANRLYSHLPDVLSPRDELTDDGEVRLRMRTASWGTLWRHIAGYVEPEFVFRSNTDDSQTVDAGLHKGYLKIGYANLDLNVGRDTLRWGPGLEGDLLISRHDMPLDLMALSTPVPFRLPGILQHLGIWQGVIFAAQLDTAFDPAPSLLSGLRLTWQPVSFVQLGYASVVQDDANDSDIAVQNVLVRLLWPATNHRNDDLQSQKAYDIVISLPFFRHYRFVNGIRLYWQHSPDDVKKKLEVTRRQESDRRGDRRTAMGRSV